MLEVGFGLLLGISMMAAAGGGLVWWTEGGRKWAAERRSRLERDPGLDDPDIRTQVADRLAYVETVAQANAARLAELSQDAVDARAAWKAAIKSDDKLKSVEDKVNAARTHLEGLIASLESQLKSIRGQATGGRRRNASDRDRLAEKGAEWERLVATAEGRAELVEGLRKFDGAEESQGDDALYTPSIPPNSRAVS